MSAESTVRNGNGPDFELIETLRWEPLCGFLRLKRHLTRLEQSARAFDFPFDEPSIRAKLEGVARGDQALRVRLALDPGGAVNVSATAFTPLAPDTVWRVAIAQTRLDKNDPLLHHKTTRRQIYEAARAEFSRDDVDEVILLNNEGRVCEGTITSVFADHGKTCCATPALDCGLLPGILREELIAGGIVHEAELTEDDLRKAKNILVGNSLRGLIRARLV
jgi:4-amino-4-deoxychorismate lyase